MQDMGAVERTIAMQAIRSGEKLPDRIANAPTLLDGLELYLNAFFELDSERTHNFGPTPIPFTSIVKYAEIYGFDEEQTESLISHVRSLDRENLTRVAKKLG